jgi:hypothetical protein
MFSQGSVSTFPGYLHLIDYQLNVLLVHDNLTQKVNRLHNDAHVKMKGKVKIVGVFSCVAKPEQQGAELFWRSRSHKAILQLRLLLVCATYIDFKNNKI